MSAYTSYTLTEEQSWQLDSVKGSLAIANRDATGITVTLTDSSGLTAASQVFDIVGDVKPIGLTFDMADVSEVPQDVPAA